MKKILTLTLVLTVFLANAQNPSGVAFKLNNSNFYKPAGVDNPGDWSDVQGAEIGYQKQLTNWLDLYVPVRIGAADVLDTKTNIKKQVSVFGLDLTGQLKYFKPTQILNPYLFAGLGAQYTRDKFDLGIPAGAGLNVLLGQGLHLNVQYGLRTSLTDFRSSYQGAAGLLFGFGGKRSADEEITTPLTDVMPVKKPMVNTAEMEAKWKAECDARIAEMQTAFDAKMATYKTECDTRISELTAQYEAKIKNMKTEVVSTPATTVVTKTDPMVSEIVIQGASKVTTTETRKVLNDAMEGVQFETGSSKIMASSFSRLNNVVRILKASGAMNLSITGHTDNQGAEAANQALSAARAKACMDYIISKGIGAARLRSAGMGSASPRASNDTKEGRFQNRRVEFSQF